MATFDYSHLGEIEQTVIKAFIRGDFKKYGVRETCRRLAKKHGKAEASYKGRYAEMKRLGTFDLIKPPAKKQPIKKHIIVRMPESEYKALWNRCYGDPIDKTSINTFVREAIKEKLGR